MIRYFAGIDVSQQEFNIAIIDTEGKLITTHTFQQSAEDYNLLLETLSRCATSEELVIGIESSGNYHINLLSFLISKEYRVVLINPLLIKNFSNSDSLRKTKTDKKDAILIANFLFKNPEKIKAFLPDDSIKLLAREREEIVQQIARLKTKIKGLVFNIFKELGDSFNILTKGMLQFLLKIPSARVAREMGIEGIQKVIDEIFSGKGRKPSITADTISKITNNTISINDPNREIILQSLIRRLFSLEEELEIVTDQLINKIKFFRPQQLQSLTSIQGIGELSASLLLAEIQNIDRFPSHKQLVAFAGLDPSIKQSGKFRGKSKISKRGNPHIRRIIWYITICAIAHSQTFRNYYLTKRRNNFPHKKAVIATSNKLLRVAFRLLHLPPPSHTHNPYSS